MIPFRNEERLEQSIHEIHGIFEEERLKHYWKFIRAYRMPVLDVGPRNWIGLTLADAFNWREPDNTLPCDFNKELLTPKEKYDTILCFEVLEHLVNPMVFMENLREKLSEDGTLYLSTPVAGFLSVYMCPQHFCEYKPEPLMEFFDCAGFRVEAMEIFRPWPWWFYFTGFRPMLRFFTNKTQLYALKLK